MKTRYALNFFLSAIFVLSVFSMGHSNLRAVGTEQFIRVGLESHFREQDQISIYATNLAVGQFVGGVFHASGFLTTTGHFLARPDNSAYVQLPYTFTSLTHAQDRAIAIHENAIPVLLHNGHWGLYLPAGADFPGAIALSPSTARVSVSKADGQIVLISENGDVNLQVRDTTGITSLGTRRYRGAIELARFTGSRLTAVNVLALEEYLLSVVPAEMPPSWHMEALMAQAVAARTFAVHRMGSMAGRGYDVCDTTMSQVYVGVSNEHPNTTQAVNATQGIMILHNNTPIEAVYSSSSGGFTEYSENA
ncbi:MAG: SpoIID/LytB domain-containing protein, partial [Defluviitaleaceae bacterium]|nr:SpoIID/LytB domain-containing protein [Defluviitaleaceae bacterium]